MNKILLTGGSGLLGTQLQKYLQVDAPSHAEFDITNPVKRECDLIIHCAAYTEVVNAETEWVKCLETNYYGTRKLIKLYKDIPFVYISTEYAKYPLLNNYALSKWLGELLVMETSSYLIIRTVFKENPFPWDKAFIDQYTQGDYIDVIAPLIADEITKWDRKSKLIYVGTGRKTIFELAKRTKPNILPCKVADIKGVELPYDYL